MSHDAVTLVVPPTLDGERIDRFVAVSTGLARAAVAAAIATGEVTIDEMPVAKPSMRVSSGQVVVVATDLRPPDGVALEADATVRFTVLHADDELIVIDKPAGLVVHPGHGNRTGTLVNGLIAHYPDLLALAVGDAAERPGIVHRLDRGTSGVMMVGRTAAAVADLSAQLADRRATRDYIAVVEGHVGADRGEVVAPIGRDRSDPTAMRVDPAGRPARTRFQVLARRAAPEPVTVLRCGLDTGRTHQIRVHMASIGHPVVGDDRYGSSRTSGPAGLARPALHAYELRVDHPATGDRCAFRAAVPTDIVELLDRCAITLPAELTGLNDRDDRDGRG